MVFSLFIAEAKFDASLLTLDASSSAVVTVAPFTDWNTAWDIVSPKYFFA